MSWINEAVTYIECFSKHHSNKTNQLYVYNIVKQAKEILVFLNKNYFNLPRPFIFKDEERIQIEWETELRYFEIDITKISYSYKILYVDEETEVEEVNIPYEKVLYYIKKQSGKQFDPEIVDIFFGIYDTIKAIRSKWE